ncbi:PrsW family intramembrane metalloprotease [Kribbella lupini]|uniref:RsiW-degrading membrane proteinase PrsW (M82 family) n=1 Tax=Kribbella lupini TaxID=291602 RepID=A0ABN1ZYE6_9ACTN
MSYPSGGPADAPQPVASGSVGAPYPQPNTLGPHPVPGQRRNRGLLIGIVIAVVFAIAGLLIFGIVAKSVGSTGFAWGMGLAFVPILVIIPLYLWLDRYEPEPLKYLVFALCWGAFIATLAAIFINTRAADLLHETTSGGSRAAVFVAPPVEEFAKGSVILLLALVRKKEFDGIIDGLVYAGMVGIGFAFTENILYFGRIFDQLSEEGGNAAGVKGVLGLFILRGGLSPFAHPLFTSFTAIGIGIAVRHRSTAVRFLAPVVGYLSAVLLHGLWNGGASWAGGSGFLTVYLFLMVPLFLAMLVFALVMRSREGQMIASRLYDYVRFGWLNGQDVPLIATLRGRKALRQNAKRYGPEAEVAAKAFQHTATELAYLRDKIVRQVIGADALSTEKKLLDELRARRPSVPFPPMPAFATAVPAFAPAGPAVPPYGGAPAPGQQQGAPGYPGGPGYGGPQQGGPAYPGAPQQPAYPGGPQQQNGPGYQGGTQPNGTPYQPQDTPRGPEQGGGPGVPGGHQPGGYPDGQPGYPTGQPGYPAGRPGYPPGPTGNPGPPGGYGPYPPSQ